MRDIPGSALTEVLRNTLRPVLEQAIQRGAGTESGASARLEGPELELAFESAIQSIAASFAGLGRQRLEPAVELALRDYLGEYLQKAGARTIATKVSDEVNKALDGLAAAKVESLVKKRLLAYVGVWGTLVTVVSGIVVFFGYQDLKNWFQGQAKQELDQRLTEEEKSNTVAEFKRRTSELHDSTLVDSYLVRARLLENEDVHMGLDGSLEMSAVDAEHLLRILLLEDTSEERFSNVAEILSHQAFLRDTTVPERIAAAVAANASNTQWLKNDWKKRAQLIDVLVKLEYFEPRAVIQDLLKKDTPQVLLSSAIAFCQEAGDSSSVQLLEQLARNAGVDVDVRKALARLHPLSPVLTDWHASVSNVTKAGELRSALFLLPYIGQARRTIRSEDPETKEVADARRRMFRDIIEKALALQVGFSYVQSREGSSWVRVSFEPPGLGAQLPGSTYQKDAADVLIEMLKEAADKNGVAGMLQLGQGLGAIIQLRLGDVSRLEVLIGGRVETLSDVRVELLRSEETGQGIARWRTPEGETRLGKPVRLVNARDARIRVKPYPSGTVLEHLFPFEDY